MKCLAGLQMVLGTVAAYISIALAIDRKSPSPGIVIPTSSPSYTLDTTLIILGLVILCLALVQRYQRIRLSTLQIICGQDIAILSIVLYRVARDNYWYTPEVYWLIFVVMGAAIAVVITGVFQFRGAKTPSPG